MISAVCCYTLTGEQMLWCITGGQFSWHLDETRFGSPGFEGSNNVLKALLRHSSKRSGSNKCKMDVISFIAEKCHLLRARVNGKEEKKRSNTKANKSRAGRKRRGITKKTKNLRMKGNLRGVRTCPVPYFVSFVQTSRNEEWLTGS